MKDGRVWGEIGQVYKPDDGPHFFVDTDNEGRRRTYIEVRTMPGGNDLTCRLATKPSWYIPDPGEIVAVLVPDGQIDHCPLVVGITDSGEADSDISEDRTLVATDKDYVIKAPSIKLGSVGVSQKAVLGDAQKDALSTFVDALNVYALGIKTIADPTNTFTPALTAAITALKAQLVLSLSPKVKLE